MTPLSEDRLVQETTANFLRDHLNWRIVFAYNDETFGPEGLLGRKNDREVVLTRHLAEALVRLNPGLADEAYKEAIRQITEAPISQSLVQANKEKYSLLRDGVKVQLRNKDGELEKQTLRVLDLENYANNDFLAVRELWVRGRLYRRRPDIVGFVNGIPLVFMELKNVHKDLRTAYEKNYRDYLDTIPHLFHHNCLLILGNGVDAKIGSITSQYEHFSEWKRLDEAEEGVVNMETLLKGLCKKESLLDIFENFVLFDESKTGTFKIIAKNHQYLGVLRALKGVQDREIRKGKLGVFWHTQGAGKSYSMAFLVQRVRRKLGGNYTFLVCTDRDDLDRQIYGTFAGCGLVDNDKDRCRAGSGEDLKSLLQKQKTVIFTLIQKFNQDVSPDQAYSNRDDIIVMSDEAHRTQYGRLALNMRNAMPRASYIGFTGTPLFADDEITRRIFGDYISTYDFQRAVNDKATVPLFYDARGDKLGVATNELNEKVAEKLEKLEITDVDLQQRLEKELKREYHIITAEKRLKQIAKDFVQHYSTAWESGKAMFICIDKITCVRMHELAKKFWAERVEELGKAAQKTKTEEEAIAIRKQTEWMLETKMAVVVSEEQGEVQRFRTWGFDIEPHRQLIKDGFETLDGKRIDVETAFKKEDHPFRVVFVCAMWLTGFDVPSLANLYLDKPLKAHTLMQAIARANRVLEGKTNGLIVDYCGILKNLRKALATFAGHMGDSIIDGQPQPEVDPVKPEEELLNSLQEAIEELKYFLSAQNFDLSRITKSQGFERNKAIVDAKEAINQNDETRKRYEILAREVFKRFKACLTIAGINDHRHDYDAVNIIYKSLQEDRDKADITEILRSLHAIVDGAIDVPVRGAHDGPTSYDISQIDFDRLRREFAKSPQKNTTVQQLKEAVESRLRRMLQQNPIRADFQKHYEELVAEYNREKDRVTIEKTFEELVRLVESLDDEARRAVREGLDEASLAIFDLLCKPDLSRTDIAKIKQVAQDLLKKIRIRLAGMVNWREKEVTRARLKTEIRDMLWDERTGLPDGYSQQDIQEKTEQLFLYFYENFGEAA